MEWVEDFLAQLKAPLDFFSWHVYAKFPEKIVDKACLAREFLDECGYENTESILNEWNYVKGWGEEFQYTVNMIHGIKGAAFTASVICSAQDCPVDMLMYYDTRPGVFNGAFDFYSYEKLKGYYPLYWYGMFYDMEKEIPADNKLDNIYSLCGVDKNGKTLSIITYYTDDDDAPDKKVKIDFGKEGRYDIYTVDETHDGEKTATVDKLEFNMKKHTILLIKEI
jgi:hypothetical protein